MTHDIFFHTFYIVFRHNFFKKIHFLFTIFLFSFPVKLGIFCIMFLSKTIFSFYIFSYYIASVIQGNRVVLSFMMSCGTETVKLALICSSSVSVLQHNFINSTYVSLYFKMQLIYSPDLKGCLQNLCFPPFQRNYI